MGVKKQMGNNHVSKINDNFQKNLIGCGLGAFFFLPSFPISLSQSSPSLSPDSAVSRRRQRGLCDLDQGHPYPTPRRPSRLETHQATGPLATGNTRGRML